ncbi:MAG: ATP-binding protein [Calditrichia bacterium]
MVKATFLSRTKLRRPLLTRTVLRNATWIFGVILALYLTFNLFTLLILDIQLKEGLDKYIAHEMEHFLNAFYFDGDSLIITNPAEFGESDLVEITTAPFFLQIYSPAGDMLMRSQNMAGYIDIPLEFPPIGEKEILLKNLNTEKENLRTGYQKLLNRQGDFVGYFQLSTPQSTASIITTNILMFNLVTFPLVLIMIILLSVFIARRSFDPVNKIIDLSKKISANNLKERLSFKADPKDEIGRLRDTLNELFDRLDNQIGLIANFTDNASHQLMSPLTVLNTELEYLLKKKDGMVDRESIQVLHEQTQRMIHIVKTLLILAKNCGDCYDSQSVFNLNQLVEEEIKSIFPHENIICQMDGEILIRGNKDYFSLVLQNLVSNALKYSPANSEIHLKARAENTFIKIYVEDQGIGISEKERNKIFERFYRGNKAQDQGIQGFGLGLSLVHSIVHSMGGSIEVKDNRPQGTIFIITLPKLQFEE